MKFGSVALKYAARSLTRHTRRTAISMAGVGIGCAMALLALSWMGGALEMQVRAIAESGSGHLMLVQEKWLETRENTLRLTNWQDLLASIQALPDVEAATARARANGLLAFGVRTAGTQITAVIPQDEYAANRILRRGTLEGRYLTDSDMGVVVIGKTLATRLNVELDDDLYATISGRNDIYSVMLRIVGILDTGSQDLDLILCHITLANLEKITDMQGVGEISLLLKEQRNMSAVREKLDALVENDTQVISWREVHPGLSAGMDGDVAFMRLLSGIVILVVSLGIASAQLTAVLERKTEFAILSALGMKSSQITGMVLVESLIIGLGGAVVALSVGGACAWYLATYGVNVALFMGDDLGFGSILLDPVLYGSFGAWLIGYAMMISITATVLASLYPAWKATHVNPADALRT